MNEITILNYLEQNPDFFERHSDFFAKIRLSSSYQGRAVSLQQRQIEKQREANQKISSSLNQLIACSKENEDTIEKIHRWLTLLLLKAKSFLEPDVLVDTLNTVFKVESAFRLTQATHSTYFHYMESSNHTDDFFPQGKKQSKGSDTAIYCGPPQNFKAVNWIKKPDTIKSIALITLYQLWQRAPSSDHLKKISFIDKTKPIGLLVIASPDPKRFTPDMSAHFLEKIGEIFSIMVSAYFE